MNKSILILSTLVDTTIAENLPSDRITVFNSLSDLSDYIQVVPIRADILYVTRELLGRSSNTSLGFLVEMLENPFLKVTEVVYITEKGARDVTSVNFIIEENNLKNWTIQYGTVTRDYVVAVITGTLRSDEMQPRRMNVVIQKRSDFIKESLGNSDSKFQVEEDTFSEMEAPEIITEPMVSEIEDTAKIYTVSGIQSNDRTIFTALFAQYLAYTGKTVIIERDSDYQTMSYIFKCSGIDHEFIDVNKLYSDTEGSLAKIKKSLHKLILIADRERNNHNYDFIASLVYSSLMNNIQHLLLEKEFNELSQTTNFITVIPNTIPDILKTVEALPAITMSQTKFAIVNTSAIEELSVPNSKQLGILLNDLFNDTKVLAKNINIKSLRLGGDAHDLSMYL